MKVYAIIEDTPGGLVKVGIAKNEQSRLSALQTAAARPLRLAHSQSAANARLVERVAHYLLREKRASGEWFRVTETEAIIAIGEAVTLIDRPGWRPPWDVDRENKRLRHNEERTKSYTETLQVRVDPQILEMIDVIRAARRPIPSRVEVIREAIEALHREVSAPQAQA